MVRVSKQIFVWIFFKVFILNIFLFNFFRCWSHGWGTNLWILETKNIVTLIRWLIYVNLWFIHFTSLFQVIYLFPQRDFLFPTTLPTKEEEEVRKAMVQMWTDFARTGYDIPAHTYRGDFVFALFLVLCLWFQKSDPRFKLFAQVEQAEWIPYQLLSNRKFEFWGQANVRKWTRWNVWRSSKVLEKSWCTFTCCSYKKGRVVGAHRNPTAQFVQQLFLKIKQQYCTACRQ